MGSPVAVFTSNLGCVNKLIDTNPTVFTTGVNSSMYESTVNRYFDGMGSSPVAAFTSNLSGVNKLIDTNPAVFMASVNNSIYESTANRYFDGIGSPVATFTSNLSGVNKLIDTNPAIFTASGNSSMYESTANRYFDGIGSPVVGLTSNLGCVNKLNDTNPAVFTISVNSSMYESTVNRHLDGMGSPTMTFTAGKSHSAYQATSCKTTDIIGYPTSAVIDNNKYFDVIGSPALASRFDIGMSENLIGTQTGINGVIDRRVLYNIPNGETFVGFGLKSRVGEKVNHEQHTSIIAKHVVDKIENLTDNSEKLNFSNCELNYDISGTTINLYINITNLNIDITAPIKGENIQIGLINKIIKYGRN
jgi:hypothetical protein